MDHEYKVSVRWFMVFNPTFNIISVTSCKLFLPNYYLLVWQDPVVLKCKLCKSNNQINDPFKDH